MESSLDMSAETSGTSAPALDDTRPSAAPTPAKAPPRPPPTHGPADSTARCLDLTSPPAAAPPPPPPPPAPLEHVLELTILRYVKRYLS